MRTHAEARAWWRGLAIGYLLVQSAALAAWWFWLLADPGARSKFVPAGSADSTLMAFCAADLLVFLPASLATLVGIIRRSIWTPTAAALHAGSAVYAAAYAIGLAYLDRSVWVNAALMAPALVVPPGILILTLREKRP